MFRPTPRDKDLKEIFCLKYSRKIRKDHTVLWANDLYQIKAELHAPLAKYDAQIRVYPDGTVAGFLGGLNLELKKLRSSAWDKVSGDSKPGLATHIKGVKPSIINVV